MKYRVKQQLGMLLECKSYKAKWYDEEPLQRHHVPQQMSSVLVEMAVMKTVQS